MNLLGWGKTEWRFITDDDLPRTADSVAEHCGTFLRALPEIVSAPMSAP
jgi:hypothetical protein